MMLTEGKRFACDMYSRNLYFFLLTTIHSDYTRILTQNTKPKNEVLKLKNNTRKKQHNTQFENTTHQRITAIHLHYSIGKKYLLLTTQHDDFKHLSALMKLLK